MWNCKCAPWLNMDVRMICACCFCNKLISPWFDECCTVCPHIKPFSFESEAYSGDSAQLYCYVAKGNFPFKITWSFHGRELSSHIGLSNAKIGDLTSLLTICSVLAANTGNYTYTAENAAGIASYSATLLMVWHTFKCHNLLIY